MKALLKSLFEGTPAKKVTKSQIVIYEGDPVSKLYYIVDGYIKVYSIINGGAERIIFIYGPGDAFPMTSIITRSDIARYFYEALTDTTISEISAEKFVSTFKDNMKAGEMVIEYTSIINEQFLKRIDILSANDARRKVVALLSFLVGTAGTADRFSKIKFPLTQQDFANMCGLTRETASIQLAKLSRSKIIEKKVNF